jgi:hypothetical protein
MRIFDETKTYEIPESYIDLEKGYLREDRLFIAHHNEVMVREEQGHYETIATYPNGGKDMEWVVDVPYQPYQEAYDEYEDIQVYVSYTAEELEQNKLRKYEQTVETFIREKYSLNAELAILRQRDTKPYEFDEYNAYAENCKARAKSILGIY